MSKTLQKQFVTAPPKYIIDTDIGDDIDDAFAIALALKLHKMGEIDLQYIITSGHGNSTRRAGLIQRLCNAEQVVIPIICGMVHSKETSSCNYMALGETSDSFPTLQETDLLTTVKTNKKTTVLCIGPLDNLCSLNFPPDKVQMILMGGCFGQIFDGIKKHIPEYNVKSGIDSWKWVLHTYPNTLVIPLDSAGLGRIPWGNFAQTKSPVINELKEMYQMWYNSYKHEKTPTLPPILTDGNNQDISLENGIHSNIQFDSVALFCSLFAEQFVIEEKHVLVDDKGFTHPEGGTNRCRVAMGWKEGGLESFQQWFCTLLNF